MTETWIFNGPSSKKEKRKKKKVGPQDNRFCGAGGNTKNSFSVGWRLRLLHGQEPK